jgi:hypothetical protein
MPPELDTLQIMSRIAACVLVLIGISALFLVVWLMCMGAMYLIAYGVPVLLVYGVTSIVLGAIFGAPVGVIVGLIAAGLFLYRFYYPSIVEVLRDRHMARIAAANATHQGDQSFRELSDAINKSTR